MVITRNRLGNILLLSHRLLSLLVFSLFHRNKIPRSLHTYSDINIFLIDMAYSSLLFQLQLLLCGTEGVASTFFCQSKVFAATSKNYMHTYLQGQQWLNKGCLSGSTDIPCSDLLDHFKYPILTCTVCLV